MDAAHTVVAAAASVVSGRERTATAGGATGSARPAPLLFRPVNRARERCSSCRFWTDDNGVLRELELGECRRRAPVLIPARLPAGETPTIYQLVGEFPRTAAEDFCGQFEQRLNTPHSPARGSCAFA
jgi:hypothetical protein